MMNEQMNNNKNNDACMWEQMNEIIRVDMNKRMKGWMGG